MKTLVKFLAAFFFIAFVANTSFAQTEEGAVCDGTGVPQQLNEGTGEGVRGAGNGNGNGVMTQIKENGGEFQATFKATLTEEQLAIIENLELTREEKREALQATFSEAQREMYDGHMAEVAERQAARGSNALNKSQMEEAVKNGLQKGKGHK
ncbi:hypothetical protein [uncultured Draconibacterium sp.]|uniref:hypothetical protein n=1 Tax=uncultured Draconibacterium sp. TaxID=1573823 RepID=UPI003260BE18